jgi:ferritin
MISKKMQAAINKQIQAEFASAYLYLSMAAYCETQNLKGFAHWLKVQNQEETGHGMKLYDFLLERGGVVELQAIEAQPSEFASPADVFSKVLVHEQQVTALINSLYEAALAEKDYASQIFLQWFISEQVEEESNATLILEKLKMIPEKSGAIFQFDKELGKRGA